MGREQLQHALLQSDGDMTKYYAASTNGFYSPEINVTDIPEDAVEITEEKWVSLLNGQSAGKLISSDKKGNPILIDFPAPTVDELISLAGSQRTRLTAEATVQIGPLQDADDLGIATDEEIKKLKAWKTYRVMLSRVDVSKVPEITWPESPEEKQSILQ